MNEPFAPLPSEVTELLDEERKAPGLSSAAKGRLVARLAALGPIAVASSPGGGTRGTSSGNTGGPASSTGAGAAAPAASAAKAVITKIGLTAFALGVGGLGGAVLQARYAPLPARTAPSANVVASVVPRADATSVPASTSSTLPSTTPAAPIVSAPRTSAAPAAAASGRDDGLRRERTSLEVARTAITRGDFDAALSALSRHSRDFPNGKLAEERDSMIVQALVGLRRHEEARAAAERFRRKFPGSLLQSSVDAAIATIR